MRSSAAPSDSGQAGQGHGQQHQGPLTQCRNGCGLGRRCGWHLVYGEAHADQAGLAGSASLPTRACTDFRAACMAALAARSAGASLGSRIATATRAPGNGPSTPSPPVPPRPPLTAVAQPPARPRAVSKYTRLTELPPPPVLDWAVPRFFSPVCKQINISAFKHYRKHHGDSFGFMGKKLEY